MKNRGDVVRLRLVVLDACKKLGKVWETNGFCDTGKPVTPDQMQGMMMPGMIMNPYIMPGAMYPGVHPQQMPYFSNPSPPSSNSATLDERAHALASNLTPVAGRDRKRPVKNEQKDDKTLKSTLCSV